MAFLCCAKLAQLPALLTCSASPRVGQGSREPQAQAKEKRHTHRGRPLQVRGCREQGRGAAVGALRVRPGGAAGCGA